MEAVNNQDDSRLAVIIEDKEGLIVGLNDTDQKISDLARDLDEATGNRWPVNLKSWRVALKPTWKKSSNRKSFVRKNLTS